MRHAVDSLLETLGFRLKQARLNANYTQQEVADIMGMSRTAIDRAEKGKCTLNTFVSILVALGMEAELAHFLPPPPISPVQLAKAQGVARKRASGKGKQNVDTNGKGELGW